MDSPPLWPKIASVLMPNAQEATARALDGAFAGIDDALFNLSQTTNNPLHMDALRILRTKRVDLLAAWEQLFAHEWKNPTPAPTTPQSRGLTLVSHDDLERQLASQQMAEVFRKRHGTDVKILEDLLHKAGEPNCVLLPEPLARLVGHWMQGMDLPTVSHLVASKIIEREMDKSLVNVYSNAIEQFRKLGVQSSPSKPTFVRPASPSVEHSDHSWLEQVERAPNRGGSAPANWTPEVQQQITQALVELLDGQPHMVEPDDAIANSEWDPSVSDLLHILQQRRTHRSQRAVHHNTMSHSAMRSVLDVLQHDLPNSVREVARDDHQSLTKQFKLEVLEKALQIGVRDPDGALNARDEDAIDIVGMLFEIFLSERSIVSDMRENIARLVAPYVKVALNDRKMFMHKAHPARRFLDVLAKACEGNTGSSLMERNTLNKVSNSIDDLVTNFNEDVAIFDLAESEIRAFIAQQKLAVEQSERRATEAQRGAERLEKAKHQSLSVFDQSTYMFPWAESNLSALKNVWVQHHTMLLLRHEDQPDRLEQSEQTLRDVVSIIHNGAGQIDSNDLMPRLHVVLADSGVFEASAQSMAQDIVDSLALAHRNTPADKPASHPRVSAVVEVQNQEVQEHFQQNSTQFSVEQHDQLIDYFKNMPMGTWVDFVRSDGTVVNTKLSWVSPISARLLFVTTRGTKHAVERVEDLAKLVLLDRVRLRDFGLGEDGFDHSFQKALQTLKDAASVSDDTTELNLSGSTVVSGRLRR